MQQHSPTFDELYRRLNDRQREAVDTIEGPVMVIAGPGTGKTQILTLRIANILKQTDIPADAILALTFTNAAAANMRKRLVAIIGSDAYRVSIFTFHSFANHIIDRHPERFGAIVGRSNASEVERIDIVRSLLDRGRYEVVKPVGEPYHNVPDIMQAISHLKREGLTPDTYTAWLIAERQQLLARDDLMHTKGVHKGKMKAEHQRALRELDKQDELALLFTHYQDELARRKRFDFDDSLLLLIGALETHEDFLRELQESYQYFLVDEHQDTNGAQNRILELLVTYFDRPNLFVVGDEKQAIFRFQGASLANFLYFEQKFRDVQRITLDTNYRSHQGVLDAAQGVIEAGAQGIRAPLTAHRAPQGGEDLRIGVYRFGADDEELLFLAEAVQTKLAEGVPAHEVAVLYRTNSDAEDIADYFERLSIPFTIESGHGVLDDPDIRALNTILRAVDDPTDEALVRVLFLGLLRIPIPDVYALIAAARGAKRPLLAELRAPEGAPLIAPRRIAKVAQRLARWKRSAENESFLRFFEMVVRESGLLTHIQASSFHVEKFDKLVRLFDEIRALVRRNPFFTLAEYRTFLTILEEHHVVLEAKSRQVPNAVRLMTVHKAKGLEFDHVFIVHAYDGHWGGRRLGKYFSLPYRTGAAVGAGNDDEDERRLFFVALTRARLSVSVSFATLAPDGRERVPSQFLAEIRPELRREHTGDELGYAGRRPPLFVERQGRAGVEKYREFVRATFLARGLSATALNNYLTCPWKWFYENFFHAQFVPSIHQEKGTAVHAALEDYFNARNQQPDLGVEVLLARLAHHLEAADLEPHAKDRLTRDLSVALSGWYERWHHTWPARTTSEVLIRGVQLSDSIRLTGKLDKLEHVSDLAHGREDVVVVDYKTGKPKSRNEIEGTTASAARTPGSGAYKRQLVFYKVLLDRFMDGRYRLTEAVLDFVEPTEGGSYRREAFAITDDDTATLVRDIERVSDEILNLTFWGTRCGDSSCPACALRELMGER